MELSRENILEHVRSFQIPLYFYYLERQFPGQAVNAALYNLRTLELHKFLDHKAGHSLAQVNQTFLKALDFTLSEILDPEVAFESAE